MAWIFLTDVVILFFLYADLHLARDLQYSL